MNAKAIGNTLKELRGKRSQEEVSKSLGISTSALGMYERGERIPRDEIKMKIAQYYSKSLVDIFFKEK